MADHNKPVLTSTYANFVSELDARFDDLSVGLDPAVTSATNLPVNTIRWNSALAKDQKWNGSAWVDKSNFYVLGSVRFGNGGISSPSITFSDDTTTGISKLGNEVIHAVAGQRVFTLNVNSVGASGVFYANNRAILTGATGNDFNQSSVEVWGGGNTNPSVKPSVGFHQNNLFAGTLRMQDASRFAFYKQGATDLAQLSVSDLVADNAVFSKDGFLTTNYVPNARNPIWRFADAQLSGISYFQGTSGYQNADSIGIHFDDASAAGSKFSFTQDGRLVTTKNIVSGTSAVHDSGQNITVNGTGTTASTAPYLTVNSRGLVAGNGSQFTSGGLLFASYRDVRTTAYVGGITMRVVNRSDVTTDPVQMEFRIGSTSGESFASAGDTALPAAPMTLSAGGVLNVSTSITTPYMNGVAAQSNGLKVTDPLATQPDRNLSNITPSAFPVTLRADFANATVTGTGGTYAGVMTFVPNAGTTVSTGGPGYQLAFGSSQANGGSPRLRIRNGIDTTWNSWVDVMTPAGAITHFARSTAPSGYLKANGAAVSRTVYQALFDTIGTTFGSGDGSTTFNLPDLRGEFVRGWDDGRGIDTGREFGSFQAGSVESHAHLTDGTLAGDRTVVWNRGVDGTFDASSGTATGNDADYRIGSKTGTYGETETRPRNIALLACIKF